MRWLSRLVSILVVAALVVVLGMLVRRKMPETRVGQAFTTCAAFRDGSKLSPGSPVLIAGVRVGEVTQLTIQGAYARVDMRLIDKIEVPIDSWVTKRAFSPFGDSVIEILPSGNEAGAATGQLLRSGECLAHVAEGASTDSLLRSMTGAMPKMEGGLERLAEVSTYGRKWAAGTLEDRTLDADHWLDDGHIAAPLAKADKALARLENATTSAAAALHGSTPQIVGTFDRIQRAVTVARKQMATTRVDIADGFQRARTGMNDVDKTIDDFNEIVAAVNENRGSGASGTLGRLINEPALADQIEEATESARESAADYNRFKSWLGLRTEFNVFSLAPRFYVTAEIRARSDKFYLVELERGPLGDFPDDQITDTAGVPAYTRRMVIKDGVRFTAQFGKTFGNWFQIRGGIKESSFGFGSDILLNRGRLRFSADAYGGVFTTPRVKLAGAMEVFRSVYLLAGIDDALNSPQYLRIQGNGGSAPHEFDQVRYGRDYFLGASLHFDDADLAVLIRVYGALIVGLL